MSSRSKSLECNISDYFLINMPSKIRRMQSSITLLARILNLASHIQSHQKKYFVVHDVVCKFSCNSYVKRKQQVKMPKVTHPAVFQNWYLNSWKLKSIMTHLINLSRLTNNTHNHQKLSSSKWQTNKNFFYLSRLTNTTHTHQKLSSSKWQMNKNSFNLAY
jgi:hypothetical protein